MPVHCAPLPRARSARSGRRAGPGPRAPRARWPPGASCPAGAGCARPATARSSETPPRSTISIVASRPRRVALDAVAGVADHLLDRRVERGERAQRAVAEPVPAGARRPAPPARAGVASRPSSRAGDADGDGLGLVLDGVDRAGQLLDGPGERGGEVVDEHRRRADLAVLELVRLERQRRRWRSAAATPARTAVLRLEVAVVGAAAQAVDEALGTTGASVLAQPGRAARRPRARRVPTAASMASRASRSGRARASMASAAS